MKLWPHRVRSNLGPVPDSDSEAVARAQEQAQEAQERLVRDEERVAQPLREFRRRNNVTAIARRLLREGEGNNGAGAFPG